MLKQHQSSSSSRKPPFFSIPNLKALLSSYDVPKPVIDPPGTAPYPFLNPNPHWVEFPEKLSLMDVDPCVLASRTEILTRTTDLTAEEHAGLPLSEPTMVSTTSESSANSEVAAPQTVKDKIVKKIDSKNGCVINCDVCKVTCSSEKVFKEHKEGKTHIKNTQKLSVPSTSCKQETPSLVVDETSDQESEKKNHDLVRQETQSLVANGTLDQESEEKNQNLLQKEGSVTSLFVCGIPDPGCDYPKIVTEQCGYIPPQVTGPSCKPTSVSTTQVQPSTGGKQKGHTKLPLWCDICKVGCSGDKCFEKHILGKLHLKNLAISEEILTRPPVTCSIDTTPVKPPVEDMKSSDSEIGDSEDRMTERCHICKINCTSSNDFIRHVSGMRHKKNLQNLEEIASLPSNFIASVSTPPNDPAEKPKSMKDEVVNSNKGNSKWCELCGILCTSLAMLNKHIKGKKHQKKLKHTEKPIENSPTLFVERALQDPMTEKGKAIISEGIKRKGPLAREEDEDTYKRQKTMIVEEEACSVSCNSCNVVCKGLMAFKTHLASSEHSAVALKQTNGGLSKQHT